MTASGPGLAVRIEDQPPAPVDVLNSDAKDFLRTQPGILDDGEDVLHWLFRHGQQLRLAFWIYSLLPAKFFEQFDSWCIGNHLPFCCFSQQPSQGAKGLIDVRRRTPQC